MKKQHFTDEMLMAYADGEIEADQRAAIELAMETDDDMMARIAMFMESSARAKEALAPLLDEPVPVDLLASVTAMVQDHSDKTEDKSEPEEAIIIPFAPTRKNKTSRANGFSSSRWAMPVAASLALVVGSVSGFFVGSSDDETNYGLQMASLNQPGIVQALNSVPSGQEIKIKSSSDRFLAIAAYRDVDGTLCREFEVDRADRSTIVAVACRADKIWGVQFAVTAGQSDTGYAPASSLAALDAYLEATGAGAPLSLEEEALALKAPL